MSSIILLFIIDTMSWLADAWNAARRESAAVFAVRWDPLGASRARLPLRGCRRCKWFGVVLADTERERRVAAWLYRWHPIPDDDDWRRALVRFGLSRVPPHILAFEGADGIDIVRVSEIQLGAAGGSRRTIGLLGGKTMSGPTPMLGGLTPERFIADLTPE